jgi:signal peptidase I
MKKKKPTRLGEIVRTVTYAVIIAFAVRTFAYEPFNIPSGSMVPTLLEGDYLFVSKFSYGYSRHTIAFGLPLFSGRILSNSPERGDIAVFKYPRDLSTDYIKRVIGLPGDRIEVHDGVLYINEFPVELERVGSYYWFNSQTNRMEWGNEYIETLPDGRQHRIRQASEVEPQDNYGPVIIPDNHYFMMGDNRDNSTDSRFPLVGFIPEENLVGQAKFLWFSLEHGAFWQIWRWPAELRSDRMFAAIH